MPRPRAGWAERHGVMLRCVTARLKDAPQHNAMFSAQPAKGRGGDVSSVNRNTAASMRPLWRPNGPHTRMCPLRGFLARGLHAARRRLYSNSSLFRASAASLPPGWHGAAWRRRTRSLAVPSLSASAKVDPLLMVGSGPCAPNGWYVTLLACVSFRPCCYPRFSPFPSG
jgi:hypothetical protein